MADQTSMLHRLLTETWPARMGKSALEALMLPGEVAQGNVQMWGDDGHTSPQVISGAHNLAGLIMSGGAGGVPAQAGEVALGNGPFRYNALDNAAAFRQRALEKRNQGGGNPYPVYNTSAAEFKAKGIAPSKESFERAAMDAKYGFRSDVAGAQEDLIRNLHPERYADVDGFMF